MDQSLGTKKESTLGERNQNRRDVYGKILEAAYNLFSLHGVAQVGIDTVIARSGCAKASLYNHFGSKEGLAIAFLDRREELWTRAWLEAGIMRRGATPEERLLGVFDVFDEWFGREDFEGCSFINVLLESEPGSPVNRAAADHLRKIRDILYKQAIEAGLADLERFAHLWHMLMKGAIVCAQEGNREAARDARAGAAMLLACWPRNRSPTH